MSDTKRKDKTKYELRREARLRGEPMQARPFPPWWAGLGWFTS